MNIAVAFVAVLAAVIGGGVLYAWIDRRGHLRFTDEAGSSNAVWALTRVELPRMALHPAWLATTTVATALVVVAVFVFDDEVTVESHFTGVFYLIAIPLGGLGAIMAAFRIANRSRRDGVDELYASTPTAPRTRTLAQLLACVGPVPIALGIGWTVMGIVALTSPYPLPGVWDQVGVLIAGMLLALVGGGVVGVLLGRWLPFAAAPVLGIAAVLWLNNAPDHLHPRFRWLRVAVEANFGGRFDIRYEALLLLFIAGLVALGGGIALARHGLGRPVVAVLVAASAVVVGTGWVMTRPPSSTEVAAVVDTLEDPTNRQECRSRGGVRYCAYPEVVAWIDHWQVAVQGVLDAVPAAARPIGVEVLMRASPGTGGFLPEVAAAVDPAAAWPADGKIHPGLELEPRDPYTEVAWQTAALAVGLTPSVSAEQPAPCRAVGQARLVLAHWLAGQAHPSSARTLRDKATDVREEGRSHDIVPMDLFPNYSDDQSPGGGPESEFVVIAGSAGSGADVLAATALLAADGAEVRGAVDANWGELVDPATPATRLLELAGVEPPTAASEAMTRPGDRGACP